MPALDFLKIRTNRRQFERDMTKIERQIVEWTERMSKREVDWMVRELQVVSPRDTGEYALKWRAIRIGLRRWSVQNSHPAAMRLEHGFVGVDAMGRHYSQNPQPHVLPTTLKMLDKFQKEIPQELQGELDRIDRRT